LLPVDEQSPVGVYAACALMTPGVLSRAREDLTIPQYAGTWRHLAERVAEPARGICGTLRGAARLSDRRCHESWAHPDLTRQDTEEEPGESRRQGNRVERLGKLV
jgi:hypothetical protein